MVLNQNKIKSLERKKLEIALQEEDIEEEEESAFKLVEDDGMLFFWPTFLRIGL